MSPDPAPPIGRSPVLRRPASSSDVARTPLRATSLLRLRPRTTQVRAARRLAAAAAFGGGGLTLLGVAGVAVILAEAMAAARYINRRLPQVHVPDRAFTPRVPGADGDARPLVLAVLGDSTAAGQGAGTPESTPGGLLGQGIADLAGRPVDLHLVARPGAVSDELYGQVEQLVEAGVTGGAALILVGANDVARRRPPQEGVRALSDAVTRLRELGLEVVVGTCPDLGSVRPVAQPLRALARRWSRRLAAAQTIAVVTAGGRVVSIGDLLGPEFDADPELMFAGDRFHPSSHAYERAAEVLLPSVAAALGVLPVSWDHEPHPGLAEGHEIVHVDLLAGVCDAAVVAAEHPGTEVAAISVSGAARGPRGLWVRLRSTMDGQRRPVEDRSARPAPT